LPDSCSLLLTFCQLKDAVKNLMQFNRGGGETQSIITANAVPEIGGQVADINKLAVKCGGNNWWTMGWEF
jgi:hypothetical protein